MLLAESPRAHQHEPYEEWLSGVPLRCSPLQLLPSRGSVLAPRSAGQSHAGRGNRQRRNVFVALSAQEKVTEILI